MIYQNILVAVDGTEPANRAITQGAELAQALGATLSVVTVSAPPQVFAAESGWALPPSIFEEIDAANAEGAKKVFTAAEAIAGIQLKEKIHMENAGAAEGIIDAASNIGADLIVMGSHGHRGINKLLLGSQASRVLSISTIPVLIVK